MVGSWCRNQTKRWKKKRHHSPLNLEQRPFIFSQWATGPARRNWQMRWFSIVKHTLWSLWKPICVWTFGESSRLSYYNHPSYIVDLDISYILYIKNNDIFFIWGSLISSFPSKPILARLKPRPAPAWPDWLARHQTRTSPVATATARWKQMWKLPSCCISYGCN